MLCNYISQYVNKQTTQTIKVKRFRVREMQIKFLGRFHPSNGVRPALPSSPTRARPLPLIDRLAGAINLLHTKSLTWRSHSRGHPDPPHNESQASLLCVQPSRVPHTIRRTLGAHTRGLSPILLTKPKFHSLCFTLTKLSRLELNS